MKKRVFSIFVVLCLLLTLVPASALAADEPLARATASSMATLQEAVNSAVDGQLTEITLEGDILDITTADIVTIPAGKVITLNMAEYSITAASDFTGRPIVNNGTLTVTGNGTIDNSASLEGGFGAIDNYGTLTIEDGTYRGYVEANGSTIFNRTETSEVTIYGGTFEGGTRALSNLGKATIYGGTFSGTSCSSCFPESWAYTIVSDGELYFYDGTVTGVQGAFSIGAGYTEIHDGHFETVPCTNNPAHENGSTSFYACYIAGERGVSEAYIYGGEFVSNYRYALYVGNNNAGGDGGLRLPASSYVSGGTFDGAMGAVYVDEVLGDPDITGGTFTSNGSPDDVSDFVDSSAATFDPETGTVTANTQDTEGVIATVTDGDNLTKYYTSFSAALTGAKEGQTVTLLGNTTVEPTIIRNGVDVNLGSHMVTINTNTSNTFYGLAFIDGDSTLTGGTIVDNRSNGNATADWTSVLVQGPATMETENVTIQTYQPSTDANYNYIMRVTESAALTLGAGTVLEDLEKTDSEALTYGSIGVAVLGKAAGDDAANTSLIVNDGATINTYGYAISGNGTSHGTDITINGGNITSTGSGAIYHPQAGSLTMNGGSLTGLTGIQLCSGSADIDMSFNGGTVHGTGSDDRADKGTGDGLISDGAAISLVNRPGYVEVPTINISAGTFISDQSEAVLAYTWQSGEESDWAEAPEYFVVTGGTFKNGEEPCEGVIQFIDENVVFFDPETGEVLPNTSETDGVVASVSSEGGQPVYYKDLAVAVQNAQSGQTVTLLDSVNLSSTLMIDGGKTLTIDLNGNDITAENRVIMVQNAHVTFTGEGNIKENQAYYGAITLKGSNNPEDTDYTYISVGPDVTLTAWSPVFITPYAESGAPYAYGVKADIYGTLTSVRDTDGALGHGIYINGQIKHTENYPVINVYSGAQVTSEGDGIYAAGYAEWNITGGSIQGYEMGIGIKSGILNISGDAQIRCTGPNTAPTEGFSNGINGSGAAIQIESNDGYAGNIEINIEGGSIISDNGYSIYEYANIGSDGIVDSLQVDAITVTDGSFQGGFCVSEALSETGTDVFAVSGGTFDTDPSAFVVPGSMAVPNEDGLFGIAPAPELGENVSLDVQEGTPSIRADALDETYNDYIADFASNTSASGLTGAAGTVAQTEITEQTVTDAKEAVGAVDGDTVTIIVEPYLDIEVTNYDASTGILSLDIQMLYNVKATKNPDGVSDAETLSKANPMGVTTPVTISIPVPSDFQAGEDLYVKHTKDNSGEVHYYAAQLSDNIVTFINPNGFGTFDVLGNDTRSTSIAFQNEDGSALQTTEYTPANVGDTLPTLTKSQYFTFVGWSIGGETYTTMTDALLTQLSGQTEVTATPVFEPVPYTLLDARNVLRGTVGIEVPELDDPDYFEYVDLNGNGRLTVGDVVRILQYIAALN